MSVALKGCSMPLPTTIRTERPIDVAAIAGLLSQFTITVLPVLLGTGRPFFGSLESDVALTHVSTKAYDFGFVQNRYRVAKGV